jgi:four helix bundle protein
MFGHEKLTVYQVSLQYVAYVYDLAGSLKGPHRHARDQLLRASQSIPLNIAEGNGKTSPGDRRRYFEIARGSALECEFLTLHERPFWGTMNLSEKEQRTL